MKNHWIILQLEFLKNYSWPGNIRELENLFKRVCALSTEK